MRALLSGRAGLAMAAYAIGWMLAPVLAIGQSPEQEEPPALVSAVTGNELSAVDAQLAAWLIVDHESQVAICQLAKNRLQDDTVRRFGQLILQDHTKVIQNLRPFSGTMLGQLDRARQLAARASRPAANLHDTSLSGPSSAGQFPKLREPEERGINKDIFLLQLKRDLGQQRVTTAEMVFEDRDHEEFDHCFLDQQIVAHRELLDTLKVCRVHAAGRFATVLDEAIATTKAHLDHAEQLADKLEATNVTAFIPLTVAE